MAVLLLTVVGLLVASVLMAFLTIVSPPVAALLTAFCLAVVGLLLMLILMLSRRRSAFGMLNGLAVLGPNLLGFIKRRPVGAIGTALALGVLTELLQRDGASSDKRGSA
ncbi:MAG: hypothetical protein R3F54_16645 [Alphaproteobacteria bacterium]